MVTTSCWLRSPLSSRGLLFGFTTRSTHQCAQSERSSCPRSSSHQQARRNNHNYFVLKIQAKPLFSFRSRDPLLCLELQTTPNARSAKQGSARALTMSPRRKIAPPTRLVHRARRTCPREYENDGSSDVRGTLGSLFRRWRISAGHELCGWKTATPISSGRFSQTSSHMRSTGSDAASEQRPGSPSRKPVTVAPSTATSPKMT